MCPDSPDSFFTQQYRWCAGSMSLLGSAKFWKTKMRPGTRCCYLSGFCYYIQTAVATFVLPVIPIVMLVLLPGQVRLHNYLWIAPSTAYNLIIFPAWNFGRYGPSSLMAKGLYGWAHTFAITDILRSKQMGWMTTGATAKRPTTRLWRGLAIWGSLTGALWIGMALYRMATMSAANFAFLFAVGIVYVVSCVGTPFLAKRQAERR
jgi:cellulose synthase (UDP-forming)